MKVFTDKQFAGGLASAVTCELYTGRTHQIRVQLSHFKHGLLGDVLYGPSARTHDLGGAEMMRHKLLWAKVRELALRQMLHAQVLGLSHPRTGESLIFTSEPPQDFQTLEKFLSDWK
jgi:23S rRNA pseudouridine1911/1915/1917 synthase